MKKERESSFGIKKIANFVDVGKVSKFLFNENVGIIMLMSLAAICHGLKDKHLIFANGRIFMVFASFLYLVVVQGSDVVSRWSRSDTKKGFLTVRNMIELGFLVVLLVAGIVTILTIFKGREDLTYNFLGVFGVIWILQCIQRLKNFSSTRDNVHKLIGPFIAIIILIFGCAMHHFLEGTVVGQFAGPVSFVLAPATMWISSLIFGDINGRSDGEDDTIHPLVGCAMAILLGFVVYAVFINPEVYGIEMTTMDAKTINDMFKKAKENRRKEKDRVAVAEAMVEVSRQEGINLEQEIQNLTQEEAKLKLQIEDSEKNYFPDANQKLIQAQQNISGLKADFEAKKAAFEPHKSHIETELAKLREIENSITTEKEETTKMMNEQNIPPNDPRIIKKEGEVTAMEQNRVSIIADIDQYKMDNSFDDLEQDVTDAEGLLQTAQGSCDNLQKQIDEAKNNMSEQRILLAKTRAAKNRADEKLIALKAKFQKEKDAFTSLKNSCDANEAKATRKILKDLKDLHEAANIAEDEYRNARKKVVSMHETHSPEFFGRRTMPNFN